MARGVGVLVQGWLLVFDHWDRPVRIIVLYLVWDFHLFLLYCLLLRKRMHSQ